MNNLLRHLFIFAGDTAGESGEEGGSSTGGTTEKLTKALKDMVKSPVFWAIVVGIILLIVVLYLLRRFVKPSSNTVKVVVRKGKIHKLIDEKSSKYFLVPFKDSLGAVISLDDRDFTSDKLFINNGPDALYKINYTLSFHVNDVEKFFKYRDNVLERMTVRINDSLREYADEGHALEIIQEYRKQEKDILLVINKSCSEFGVEATALKVNFIEPTKKM